MRSLRFGLFALAPLCTAAALGALALSGCDRYPACKKDKDCRAELGERCVANTCQNCTSNADCEARSTAGQPALTCNAGRCGAPGGGPGGVVGGVEGDPCAQRVDCMGGLACTAGVCAPCSANTDCSPSTCNAYSGRCSTEGACDSDDQCAIDEICDAGMCLFSGDLGEPQGPCGLDAVYFGFDSAEMTPQIREQVRAGADCMAQYDVLVYLEAHADDRGTEEYNILLTERRGRQVHALLVELGVSKSNLQVIAKGDLEAQGRTESDRAKDRRVQFVWSRDPSGEAPGEVSAEPGDSATAL